MLDTSKIYLKKIDTIGKFSVWFVNGEYIRKNIDENFVECDHHYHFKFIPQHELWVDSRIDPLELPYFVDNMLVQYRLMQKGMSHEEALKRADAYEKKERAKSVSFNYVLEGGKKPADIIEKIHRTPVKKYSSGCIKIWLVDGKLVRDYLLIEYAEGGHDLVYSFIPSHEIWIEEILSKEEQESIILHELHERYLMSQGKAYREAHKGATIVEDYYRDHPNETEERIRLELEKNNDIHTKTLES